jgi:pyruvate dehydrogenase E2 component (dihydrolipoamide acetyltransferase)
MSEKVLVPDVGEADGVEVIEVLVKVGDMVAVDDSLVVLESDKASMEIPSPMAGKIVSINVSEGDKIEEGGLILELEAEASDSNEKVASEKPEESPAEEEQASSASASAVEEPVAKNTAAQAPASNGSSREATVSVPDVGDASDITVTEVLVKIGDQVNKDDSLVVLESDKASMEIPAPFAGEVLEVLVKEGDEVNEGDSLFRMKHRVMKPPKLNLSLGRRQTPNQNLSQKPSQNPNQNLVPQLPQQVLTLNKLRQHLPVRRSTLVLLSENRPANTVWISVT